MVALVTAFPRFRIKNHRLSLQAMVEYSRGALLQAQQRKTEVANGDIEAFERSDKLERRQGSLLQVYEAGVERARATAAAAQKEAEGDAAHTAAHTAAEAEEGKDADNTVMQPINEWQRSNSHCLSPWVTAMWLHDEEEVQKVSPLPGDTSGVCATRSLVAPAHTVNCAHANTQTVPVQVLLSLGIRKRGKRGRTSSSLQQRVVRRRCSATDPDVCSLRLYSRSISLQCLFTPSAGDSVGTLHRVVTVCRRCLTTRMVASH
jgi:hypothetical protein